MKFIAEQFKGRSCRKLLSKTEEIADARKTTMSWDVPRLVECQLLTRRPSTNGRPQSYSYRYPLLVFYHQHLPRHAIAVLL